MKELKEILSRTANGVTSVELSGLPPAPAEEEEMGCAVCGGAGFVRRELPVDDPQFGRAQPCACILDEEATVRRSRLERISNLGALTRFTFATVRPASEGPKGPFEDAMAAARAYADSPSGWLAFTGPSGSGKTHLAAAIANDCVDQGRPALFMVVPDFLDHLRASYDAEAGDLGYDELFEQVRNAPLLFLDDIDAAAPTAWAKEKLFQVVNHRFNATLPTVFTSTTSLDRLDERLATRLRDERLAHLFPLERATRSSYQQVGGMSRERLAELRFNTFDLRKKSLNDEELESLQSALNAAIAFAESPHGFLTLQGTNGCGKTHLAGAIANKALAGGMDVFFAVVPDLLDYLRATFAPGRGGSYEETFDSVRSAELLVLDDLGAERSAEWAEEKLYQVVNYRALMRLPTIVSTDQSDSALQRAHPRVYSRIRDTTAGTFIVISAPHHILGNLARPAEQSHPKGSRGHLW